MSMLEAPQDFINAWSREVIDMYLGMLANQLGISHSRKWEGGEEEGRNPGL
jgi:hypothetical protein